MCSRCDAGAGLLAVVLALPGIGQVAALPLLTDGLRRGPGW